MQQSSVLKRMIMVLGIVLAIFAAIFMMLLLRKRMQHQAGVLSTPVPSIVVSAAPTPKNESDTEGTPTPAPSVEPTPFVDSDTVQDKSRGLLVAAVQERLYSLGYYSYKPTGYFAGMTQNAVRSFQLANHLAVDGIVSKETYDALFSSDAKYAAATPVPLPTATPPAVKPRDYGEAVQFKDANTLMPVGSRFLVVDLNSQYYFYATRQGGTNHMEIVPASQEDQQRYLSIFSGRSTFDKRPCVIEYNDHIIAASLCGWMHGPTNGVQTLSLYFFGSTADDSSMEDAEHSANLLLASDGVLPK